MTMPVLIRGRQYQSVKNAARYLRLSPSAISQAIARGRPDSAGLGTGKTPRDRSRCGMPSKPVQIGPYSAKSLSQAARELGVDRRNLARRIAANDTEWLMATVIAAMPRVEIDA